MMKLKWLLKVLTITMLPYNLSIFQTCLFWVFFLMLSMAPMNIRNIAMSDKMLELKVIYLEVIIIFLRNQKNTVFSQRFKHTRLMSLQFIVFFISTNG